MIRLISLLCLCSIGCGAASKGQSAEWPFDTPRADAAMERAPDIFAQARTATLQADNADQRGDKAAAADRRTEARLLLTAAIVEAERVDLDNQRLSLERQEEEIRVQTARDREARLRVAEEISRTKAAAIAMREAAAAHQLAEQQYTGSARAVHRSDLARARNVLIDRLTLALSTAEVLGAPPERVVVLWKKVDYLRDRSSRLDDIERLTSQVYDLLGTLRAKQPSPSSAMVASLMASAKERGFGVDQLPRGVVITVDGLFTSGGRVSAFRSRRLVDVIQAFPHGPVQCAVLVRADTTVWKRRVRALIARFERGGVEKGRVVGRAAVTEQNRPVRTECTFVAYQPKSFAML